jgi:molybdopterin/thiamine biosynthesis adenylyltransferase
LSRVLIVGVGGLGCPASLALAPHASRLTLVDFDVVEVTNLHRQPWHHPADLGRLKVDSATEKLRRAFPQLQVVSLSTRVNAENVEALFRLHEVVIDGTDSAPVKFLLNDAAVRTGTTLIYGGVLRFGGQAMRIQPGGPCLRCLFEGPGLEAPSCAQAGVLGSMAGVIGGLQAELAFGRNPVAGEASLHVVDALAFTSRTLRVKRAPDCPACSQGSASIFG